MISRLLKGAAAGIWGTLAMAGVALTIRRLRTQSEALSKTDPEHAIDWMLRMAAEELPPPRQRRRIADPLLFAVDAIGWVADARATPRHQVSPWAGGIATAALMWVIGFCWYMPSLGILPLPWKWEKKKLFITSTAYLAYGLTMALLLGQFQRRQWMIGRR
ncbi:MAG TPA: hypothetical protein VJP78_04080 [Thermoleophilia bacterium]|nr:hypothetical protein [Acidimicrobiia bacterium]HLA80798.1 hypothetical protein [Thermoleophilia bacterium]